MTSKQIAALNNLLKSAKDHEFEDVPIKTLELELLLEAAEKSLATETKPDPALDELKHYIRSCIILAYNEGTSNVSSHSTDYTAIVNHITEQCNIIFLK